MIMPVLTDVQKAKFFIWNDGDPTQAQIATEASSGGRDCFVQINPASIHIGSSRGTSGMIGPQLPNAGAQSFTGTGPAATEPPAQQPIRNTGGDGASPLAFYWLPLCSLFIF